MIPRISHAALLATLSLAGCGGSTVMHLGDTGTAGSAGDTGAQTVGSGGQGTGSGSFSTGGTDVAGATDAGMATCAPNAGQSMPLAMTNLEYDNTVRDLLGDSSAPSKTEPFVEDPPEEGFRREVAPVSMLRASNYMKAAEGIALRAESRLGEILPCNPTMVGEDACAAQFIATFGRRAFRRPLTPAETSAMQQIYANKKVSTDFAHAIGPVIAAMLASPSFYEIEPKGAAPGLAPLGPYQLASRLSYFIYRSMPDAQLLDAAEGGTLATTEGVTSQAKRMLADPKAHNGVINFFSEWLALDRLDTTVKDPTLFPTFNSLRADMATETTKFVESVFFGDGLFKNLLTSSISWVNEPLANFYGQPGVMGSAFQKVQLNPMVRAGILTQASFLSIYAGEIEGSPSLRGIFVRDKVLCQPVPPPPPSITPLPPKKPGQTNRQQYESAFSSQPACVACHRLIEPIGYGFEEFDAIGRFRVTDSGLPVDASGRLENTNDNALEGPFNGAVELSTKLASSSAAKECAAKWWFRYALSRGEADEDSCALATAVQAIQTSGSLPALVIAIASSDSFRYARW